jgi:hypothetical protein
MRRLVIVLKPVRPDDGRMPSQKEYRFLKSSDPFLLGGGYRTNAMRVFVAARILRGCHIKLAHHEWSPGQGMERIQKIAGERSVIPWSIQVAGHSVKVCGGGADHLGVIKGLVTIPENKRPLIDVQRGSSSDFTSFETSVNRAG